MPLVLVGPSARWATELPDVTLTGRVTDDELAAIYTGAHALVFPSDDEGFGLPPVEALACGTPVVACDVPALREVLDGRAQLCRRRRPRRAGRRGGGCHAGPRRQPPRGRGSNAAEATWDVYEDARGGPHGGAAARRRADALRLRA